MITELRLWLSACAQQIVYSAKNTKSSQQARLPEVLKRIGISIGKTTPIDLVKILM